MSKVNYNKFLHLIRYGTAGDQKYLLGEFLKTYDLAVVNANILVHTPAAISSFLFEHTLNKPFIIDPQTYAYALDFKFITSSSKGKSKGKIKKPYVKLSELYEASFQKAVENKKPLSVANISDCLDELVINVCDFQLSYLTDQMKDDDVEKYYDFVEEEGGLSLSKTPEFIIPPYFFLDANKQFNDWLKINIRSIETAVKKFPKHKIAAQLVLSKDVLYNEALLEQIVSSYSALKNVNYILFWIDDHNESSLPHGDLTQYLNFLNSFRNDKKLISLYGGAFSIIAGRTKTAPSLSGVCHSIEYGEVRPVAPVGGGIPVSKFYVPSAFHRYLYRQVIAIVTDNGWLNNSNAYYEKVCNCKTCKEVIQDNPDVNFEKFGKMNTKKTKGKDGVEVSKQYPTGEAKDICKQHYMHCKYREYSENTFADLKKSIRKLQTSFADIPSAVHLKQWILSLEAANKK